MFDWPQVSGALSILYSLGVYLSTHQVSWLHMTMAMMETWTADTYPFQHQVKSTLDNLPQKFLLQQGIFCLSAAICLTSSQRDRLTGILYTML